MQSVHLNYQNLEKIPEEVVTRADEVRELYLKRNCFRIFPNLHKFVNLTKLYLGGNFIEQLPGSIGLLGSLQVLDLHQNNLCVLNEAISGLGSLEILILTQNKLNSLPKGLGNLRNLRILEVSSNRLTSLNPESFQGMVSLQELAMDLNRGVTSLPRNLLSLPQIAQISACKCDIRYLPAVRTPQEPLLYFDGNTKLNYIPFTRALSSSSSDYGCGESEGEPMPLPGIEVSISGTNQALYFDGDLLRIHHPLEMGLPSRSSPSLLELTLKSLFKMRIIPQPGILPLPLQRLLSSGPIFHCHQCQEPIFSEVIPLPYQSDRHVTRIHLFCVFFCSIVCFRTYLNYSDRDVFDNEILEWTMIE